MKADPVSAAERLCGGDLVKVTLTGFAKLLYLTARLQNVFHLSDVAKRGAGRS